MLYEMKFYDDEKVIYIYGMVRRIYEMKKQGKLKIIGAVTYNTFRCIIKRIDLEMVIPCLTKI